MFHCTPTAWQGVMREAMRNWWRNVEVADPMPFDLHKKSLHSRSTTRDCSRKTTIVENSAQACGILAPGKTRPNKRTDAAMFVQVG